MTPPTATLLGRVTARSTVRFGPRFGLLLAWAAIDAAVAIYLRVYGANVVSAVLLVGGLIMFGLATASRDRSGTDIEGAGMVLLAGHLVIAAVVAYRTELPSPPDTYRLFALASLGALLVAVVVRSSRRSRSVPWSMALWLTIGSGLAYRVAIVATDVVPPFDVPLIQQAAGQALLRASDPYLTAVYVSGYPYLPIAAVAAAFGEALGDARWMSVVGDALVVVGLVLFARRVGAAPRLGLVLASLWTWWSGGPYVTWQGFPEPILIGFLALGAAAMAGPRPQAGAGGILLGLAAATKQFGLGLLPLLPWRSGPGRRALLIAIVTWLVVVIPFAMWHAPEFAEGAAMSLIREPGRPYALNVLNWPGITLDAPLLLAFPTAIAFGWVCQRRQAGPVAAWLAGSGGLLLLAFALNRIAFVNYYAIPLALLLLLMLAYDGSCRNGAVVARNDRQPG